MALGAGDVVGLLDSVRQKIGRDAPLVLLLQEVYRNGAEVPATLMTDAVFAGRLAGASGSGRRNDIAAVAAELDLSVCYIPSMRNGAPAESDEDRGNAVLSNLPLTDLMAIELPFERQRRVAVAATVSGLSMGGSNWTVRFVSAHLDNMVGARRGWFAGGEYARARQARGLVTLLEGASSPRSPLDSGTDHDTAVVLGGDFNTWFGFSDQAYIETARAFPQTRISDTRATFLGLLRLDHLFFRLPERWRAEFHRENDRFGSDHYPLVATIRF
jgi:endonuclease/exonuclease/phosphatase family metal-dependent hydrolase